LSGGYYGESGVAVACEEQVFIPVDPYRTVFRSLTREAGRKGVNVWTSGNFLGWRGVWMVASIKHCADHEAR
jgi:hypothetical protein